MWLISIFAHVLQKNDLYAKVVTVFWQNILFIFENNYLDWTVKLMTIVYFQILKRMKLKHLVIIYIRNCYIFWMKFWLFNFIAGSWDRMNTNRTSSYVSTMGGIKIYLVGKICNRFFFTLRHWSNNLVPVCAQFLFRIHCILYNYRRRKKYSNMF